MATDDVRGHRYYVYTLAHPDGRVFYVGKGTGDRILDHEAEAQRGVQSEKCDIIRAIWSRGEQVVRNKVALFDTDEEARRYEHHLIASLPELANVLQGGGDLVEVNLSPEDQHEFGASIRHFAPDGRAYWSAREMAGFLGYAFWHPFKQLVDRVEGIFTQAGMDTSYDFQHATMSVLVGNGARLSIDDVQLSRTAFLFVLQYADLNKTMVEVGKSYIALHATHADWAGQPVISRSIKRTSQWARGSVVTYRSRQALNQASVPVDRAAGDEAAPPSGEIGSREASATLDSDLQDIIDGHSDVISGASGASVIGDHARGDIRKNMARLRDRLLNAAREAGVVTQQDIVVFEDHGYRGLYTETARQIAARKRLDPGEHILDYMGPEESVNNLFRIVQTEAKIRRDGIDTKERANATHFQVGRAVRDTIIGLGGTPPEQLPAPEHSIQQLRRDEARRQRIEAEDRLGLFAQLMAGGEDDSTADADAEGTQDGPDVGE